MNGVVSLSTTIRSEWIKLRSVRSSVVTLVAAGIVVVLLGAMLSSVASEGSSTPMPLDATGPLDLSLAGINLSVLLLGVLGAVLSAGEYSTGLVQTMFVVVPDRLRVLWAKCALLVGTAFPWLAVSCLAAFLIGQAVYSGQDPTLSLGDPGVLRAVLGAAFYSVSIGVIGIGLGFLLRSTAAAVGGLVALVMVLPVLAELLPGAVGDTVADALPSGAGSAVMTLDAGSGAMGPGAGVAVLAAWMMVLTASAAFRLRTQDA